MERLFDTLHTALLGLPDPLPGDLLSTAIAVTLGLGCLQITRRYLWRLKGRRQAIEPVPAQPTTASARVLELEPAASAGTPAQLSGLPAPDTSHAA